MMGSQICTNGGCWFLPLRNVGANCEIWHGSLFTAATAPTSGITLSALYSSWDTGTEDILEIFHFYPFRVPIVPTVLLRFLYVKFQLSSFNSFWDMMGSQVCTSGGCWFLPPAKCRGQIGRYCTVVFLQQLEPQRVV